MIAEFKLVKDARGRRRAACLVALEQKVGKIKPDVFDYAASVMGDQADRRKARETGLVPKGPEVDVIADQVADAIWEVFLLVGRTDVFQRQVEETLRKRVAHWGAGDGKDDAGAELDDEDGEAEAAKPKSAISGAVLERQITSSAKLMGAIMNQQCAYIGFNRFLERLHLAYAEQTEPSLTAPLPLKVTGKQRAMILAAVKYDLAQQDL